MSSDRSSPQTENKNPGNMNPEIRKLNEKDDETSRRVHILEAEVASLKEQLTLIKSYLDDIIDSPAPRRSRPQSPPDQAGGLPGTD